MMSFRSTLYLIGGVRFFNNNKETVNTWDNFNLEFDGAKESPLALPGTNYLPTAEHELYPKGAMVPAKFIPGCQ